MSSLDFHTLVTFICGDASAPPARYLLLRLAPGAKEGPKTGGWISSGRALLDRVCLSLESGFAGVYSGPSQCSVEVHQQEWVGVQTLLPLAASSSILMTSRSYWPPMSNSQFQL